MSRPPRSESRPGVVRTLFALIGGDARRLRGRVHRRLHRRHDAERRRTRHRARPDRRHGGEPRRRSSWPSAIPSGSSSAPRCSPGASGAGLDEAVDAGRVPRRLGTILALPFRVLAALPRTLLLMAAVLLLIFVVAPVGPGKLAGARRRPRAVPVVRRPRRDRRGPRSRPRRGGSRRRPGSPRAATIGLGVAVAVVVGRRGHGAVPRPGHGRRPGPALDGPRRRFRPNRSRGSRGSRVALVHDVQLRQRDGSPAALRRGRHGSGPRPWTRAGRWARSAGAPTRRGAGSGASGPRPCR